MDAAVNPPVQLARTRRGGRRWRLSGGHVLSSCALVLLVTPPPPTPFASHLPAEVPDLGRWDKASGSAELRDGTFLEYELYFDPARAGYELIRYRLSGWDGGEDGPPYSANERLQWQAQLKDLRRYECEPLGSGGCRWREFEKNTEQYKREVQVVMWVLALHRRLLYEREAGLIP